MASSRILTLALDRTLPAFGADRATAIGSDEAALVAELQAGSEPAFAYLVGVFESPIYNLVWRLLGNEADAADVLQEVFVKVFRGVKQFRGASSLKTWIYRIALHEASNHRRGWLRRHAHEPFSLDEELGQPWMAVAEAAQSSSETPYQSLEQAEWQALVGRALASLAEPYRTAVALREIEDLSYEEIAEVLGVTEGTVKSRLMRGRQLLRRKLTDWK